MGTADQALFNNVDASFHIIEATRQNVSLGMDTLNFFFKGLLFIVRVLLEVILEGSNTSLEARNAFTVVLRN